MPNATWTMEPWAVHTKVLCTQGIKYWIYKWERTNLHGFMSHDAELFLACFCVTIPSDECRFRSDFVFMSPPNKNLRHKIPLLTLYCRSHPEIDTIITMASIQSHNIWWHSNWIANFRVHLSAKVIFFRRFV